MGIKLADPKRYITPAPGAYEAEKGEKYLAENLSISFGIRLKSPDPYVTPAPGAYRPEEC